MPTKDPEKRRKHQRDYYARHPELAKDSVKRRKKALRKIIKDRKDVACMDCGLSCPPYCMDFDHKREKKYNVSQMIALVCSEEKLLSEMDKCDVVCANCHRERTHGPRK